MKRKARLDTSALTRRLDAAAATVKNEWANILWHGSRDRFETVEDLSRMIIDGAKPVRKA